MRMFFVVIPRFLGDSDYGTYATRNDAEMRAYELSKFVSSAVEVWEHRWYSVFGWRLDRQRRVRRFESEEVE